MANVHSHDIIKGIRQALFEPEKRRLQGWIDQLAQKNKTASDLQDPLGFWFEGRYFRPSWLGQGKYRKPSLHISLHDEADALIADEKQVLEDNQFIAQTLFSMIEPCDTYRDIRDTLPECLVEIVTDLSSMSRTREPAFTIKNNKRALRDYQQILPKIEIYCTTRLIY